MISPLAFWYIAVPRCLPRPQKSGEDHHRNSVPLADRATGPRRGHSPVRRRSASRSAVELRGIRLGETEQRQPRAFYVRQGGIDLLALTVVVRTYPGAGASRSLPCQAARPFSGSRVICCSNTFLRGRACPPSLPGANCDTVLPQGKPRRDDQLHDKGRQHRRRWRSDRRRSTSRPTPPSMTIPASKRKRRPRFSMCGMVDAKPSPIPNSRPDR